MSKKGVHRVPPNDPRARRMSQAKGAVVADDSKIPENIRAHNDQISAVRAARIAARERRRG